MSYTVYDTPAIIANSWPYKDASRRLVVYSRDVGRMLVRGQAVRKLDSKLGSAVQPYAESELELVYGKSGWRLVGARPRQNFFFSAQSGRPAIRRTTDLLSRLVPAQQPDRKLYQIVTAGLTALQSVDEGVVDITESLFVFRLVAHLGYAPDPSGPQLSQFLTDQSYSDDQLSAFAEHRDSVVTQINQALKSTQL